MMNFVSVVIVTYNPKVWMDRCFLSLKESSVKVKTIVIDNGSIDGSQEIIKQNYPEVDFYQAKENLGFGLANNVGIRMAYDAGAEYTFLLNQDAWVEHDTIERLVNKMQVDTSYGVLSPIHLNGSGDAFDFNFSNYISPINCPKLFSDIYLNRNLDQIYESLFVNAAAWLVSRKCIENVGGFSPSFFHYGEDDNYVSRMRFHKVKLGVYPLTQIYHDRDQRPVSEYFSDYGIAMERNFISFISNPIINMNTLKVQLELLKYVLRAVFDGKFKKSWLVIKKLPLLTRKLTQLRTNRELSMQNKKLCFLTLSINEYLVKE